MMKTAHLQSLVISLVLLFGASEASAQGLQILPVVGSDFRFEPTLTIVGGGFDTPSRDGTTLGIVGIGLITNCGLFQIQGNRVRNHAKLLFLNGSDLTAQTFSISPRYTLPVSRSLSVNIGPTAGAVNVRDRRQVSGEYELLASYGVAGGIEYRRGHAYAGIDLSYEDTTRGRRTELEKTTLTLNIGYHF